MKTRLYNARILTMAGAKASDQPIFEGEVWVDGDRIAYVGDGKTDAAATGGTDGTAPAFDREIDCGGNLLMPGFKDAHTHSAMTFLRSHADDLPLQDWLNNQVFPFEARLTPDDIRELTKLAILEYLTTGVTSIMEMYLTPETIAEACNDLGMRCVQVGSCNNFSQSAADVERWYKELNGTSDLTSFQIGFHAEYTCSPELMEQFADMARRYQAPVFTHCEETKAETEGCIERYGKTPIAYLADLGMFDYGGAGYHLVWTNEEDRAIMRDKGIGVVTNPASNAKLASGIAPISAYLEAGIPVAIGTDGPASNNCLDMFREMFLVTALAKLREHDASAVPAYDVLRMATYNGAHIMQIPDADCVAAGKLADLVLIDLDQPNMQPIHNIAANVVYAGSKSNVKMTMIAGKVLYDRFDGTERYHVGVDPEEVYATCAELTHRLTA